MFDPVPFWMLVWISLFIASFCAYCSCFIMDKMRKNSENSIYNFTHQMMDLCDRNNEDTLEEIEKLKDRILWLERSISDLKKEKS